jgi:hypothetical protein
MSTTNNSVIFQGLLVAIANLLPNAPQVASFDFQNPTLQLPNGFYYNPSFQLISGAATFVPFPPNMTTAFLFAALNLSTANPMSVGFSVSGASAGSFTLGPGGFCVFGDPSFQGLGFSSFSLTMSLGNGQASIFVGG